MLIELFLVALNFFSISIGIGFIITFEFFLGILSISSSFSPQEINLETVIISFSFFDVTYALSLNLCNKFVTPFFFII